MKETDEKFDKMYEILSKVITLDPGTEKERRMKAPELIEHESYLCKRIVCHLAGCHGWLFQLSYDEEQDKYFFAAEHSEMVSYSKAYARPKEKVINFDHVYNFPLILLPNTSSFYFNITDLGEEESISRIRDIITWIRLNKEEAFVFSVIPSAFIRARGEKWSIPRFKLDCNPDLLDPKNLSLYNSLIDRMRPKAANQLERVRKDSICREIYRSFRYVKRYANHCYNEAINVARKEYPMDILKFLPMFRAVVIDEKGKINLYISRKVLKKVDKEVMKLALDRHPYRAFLEHLLDDKFDADKVTNRLEYIYNKNHESYDRIIDTADDKALTFPFLLKKNKPYIDFVDDVKISIKPYDYLPSDIDLYEEKSISYWASINTDDMKIFPYDFDLKWGQDIHQFNAGDYRLADLMTWMEKNYFNKEKGEDVK